MLGAGGLEGVDGGAIELEVRRMLGAGGLEGVDGGAVEFGDWSFALERIGYLELHIQQV